MEDLYNLVAIWWLSEKECRVVLEFFSADLPSYILGSLDSMVGRPKRGRLWFPGDEFKEFEIPEGAPLLQTDFIAERGGIVIHGRDASSVACMPGYVSRIDLRPWFQSIDLFQVN